MKRLILIISIVLCSFLTAFAEQVKVPDITLAQGGSATVEILLNNEHANIVAFQMDLTLPEGVGIDKTGCKLSSRITDTEQDLVIGKLESGVFRLISTSMSLSSIQGTEGAILILKLYSEENFVKGQAVIDNIYFATSESERIMIDNVSFTINTKYTLSYKVDGETYKTYEVEYDSVITPEPSPTKEGYTFSGWSEIPETMPAKNVEVVGTFAVNQYKMTFVLNNGEEDIVKTQDYASELSAPADPTKVGFTFKGWDTEVPTSVPAQDMTFTAQWERNKYKLTWVVDGEETVSEVFYEAEITKPADPTKGGYTFKGWTPAVAETMPAEDVTYTAQFDINSYTLTYKVDGEVYKTYEVEYGASITPEAEPTQEGYTFSGWSDIPATMPAENVVVTGTFTIIDGINTIAAEVQGTKYYTLDGKPLNKPQRGINIVKYSDGITKKVMMK